MFYSESTKGFYDPEIHSSIPNDAIELPKEQYSSLIQEQSQGKVFTVLNNAVHAVERTTQTLSIDDYKIIVQKYLDQTAQSRGYDNIVSACSYLGSSNTTFKSEAQSCLDFRDEVWGYCYSLLAQVQAGTKSPPTKPELISLLPKINW